VDLTRRALFRSAAVVGGAVAVGGSGLAAEAVAGTTGTALSHTTADLTILKGKANGKGWRPLVKGPAETHQVRTGVGAPAKSGRGKRRTPVLVFAQLSDVHIVDSQSPARLEGGDGVSSSAYRPQEILTAHIAESMVRQLNRVSGPITGLAPALAVQTGDNSDNGQRNEIRWNIDILSGGQVRPDSGDLTRYEGVMDNEPGYYDTAYWHPHGTPAGQQGDNYRRLAGFPTVPGLLDKCRKPFRAHGLDFPWLAVFGNHDELVQGNFARSTIYENRATGSNKPVTVSPGNTGTRPVTPDPDRHFLSRQETVEEHFTSNGLPVGHGFTDDNRTTGTGYYAYDQGLVRFLILDSVHDNTDRGSIDQTQFEWLQQQLASSTDKYVVVCSHHTSWTMNASAPASEPFVNGDAVVAELLSHPHLIAWVNGHTHRNAVQMHTDDSGHGFWEINTASHIDFPQQSRLIEILDNHDGSLSIFCTMVDHQAHLATERYDTTMQLASLGRLLAANDPQERDDNRRGTRADRNVELLVAKPALVV
jgi:metallophosphoesterase (TIGR03767 family)